MSEQEQEQSPIVRKVYTFASVVGPKELWDKLGNANANNAKIVFYNPQEQYPVKGFRTIVRRKNKSTGSVFYSMHATKYGAIVPGNTTHIAVAMFGKSKIEKLYEMELPRPYSKTTVKLGKDGVHVLSVRRSAKNVFITVGEANYNRVNKNSKKVDAEIVKHKDINEKWIQL